VSVDTIKDVYLPFLARFGAEGASLDVKKRGLAPSGGGEVLLNLPIVKEINHIDFIDVGKVKRIRGVVYSCKINPNLCNSVVNGMRNILNDYIPDVWIHLDHFKGETSGD